ncbi:hypothetical protein [Aurantiacibacter xanthus]|nr:hypothetical protein [Aurantiacibacter xanthus]
MPRPATGDTLALTGNRIRALRRKGGEGHAAKMEPAPIRRKGCPP